MRFVELWTLRRGVLAVPEPLDADGQDAAFERWTRDEPSLFERPENVDCIGGACRDEERGIAASLERQSPGRW